MSDNVDVDGAALALLRLEIADPGQDLAIQDVLASQTFPQFSKLPIEIRLMVYRCMFPEARRFIIYWAENSPHRLQLRVPMPPITSQINMESRKETLKAYHLMNASHAHLQFGSRFLSSRLLWNPQEDIVHLELYIMLYNIISGFFTSDRHWSGDFSNILELVLRKSGGNQTFMETWRDNTVKAFNAYKDLKAKTGVDIHVPVIRIWED
ncbi:hypothetical protein DL98DRAFT_592866 [Cadophora sp. DSE1049]|nr:hypothetical protein DL98DRAFT_592866 [Cadophora sp. DSE1049]